MSAPLDWRWPFACLLWCFIGSLCGHYSGTRPVEVTVDYSQQNAVLDKCLDLAKKNEELAGRCIAGRCIAALKSQEGQ